jgi:hypothetical protein
MRGLRTRLAASLRSTVERHLQLIDHLSEDPPAENPDLERRVAVLARTARDGASREE